MMAYYKIEKIEGIGPFYAEKLRAIGIKTVSDLLEKGATKKGRANLVATTGISERLILKWTNHADLLRIKGIGGQFAELLELAGVDTVKELSHRIAASLHARMLEVNAVRNLSNWVPDVRQLTEMIKIAQTLEPKMTY